MTPDATTPTGKVIDFKTCTRWVSSPVGRGPGLTSLVARQTLGRMVRAAESKAYALTEEILLGGDFLDFDEISGEGYARQSDAPARTLKARLR